ncbi:thioesterase-like superfamily protein [Sarocladium implicatum]|nr:thioesterase-like superfamily protein [Sarocladium implicatum]
MSISKHSRMSFAEAMALVPLPSSDPKVQRFMAEQPAWFPGKGLSWERESVPGLAQRRAGRGITAAGIHVYAQAPLAAARVVEQEEKKIAQDHGTPKAKFGIHTIQGVYTNPAHIDRPLIYEVSKVASGRSFATHLVNARQSIKASKTPDGPFDPREDAHPQGEVCFTCLTTFKRSFQGTADVQVQQSPQERFAHILSQRLPDEWPPCPQIDLDIVTASQADKDHGTFPILDMYKVDMSSYNDGKPVADRRELIFYRPCHPINTDDVNAHIVCHGAESDRNGFLMLANHIGFGHDLSAVASLSFAFYIHVNPEEAVMDGSGWWIQEIGWPRTSAGRAMFETRTWSPEGKHVATGIQDGLMLPGRREAERQRL